MAFSRDVAKRTLFHLAVETFFAVLPLLVMSLMWPPGGYHPKSFWLGPEISMTSCILYGLALSKLIQGSATSAPRVGRNFREQLRQARAGYSAVSLLPMLGVILSVITITKMLSSEVTIAWYIFQYVNFVLAVVAFFVLGGYGINRSEQEDDGDGAA